jgi:hypothetical protein
MFQFRDQSYRQAYFSFTDAILVSQIRSLESEFCDDIIESLQNLGSAADGNDSRSESSQIVTRSAIYLELKMKQVSFLNCLIFFSLK